MISSSKGGLPLGQSSEVRAQFIDLRVLLVDDDSTTLAVVSSMLKVWKYKVETAKNPLDALSTLRSQNGHFDLVVTDLHMPFMNGFDLQKQIDKEFKLPVILMSADDHESVLQKSLQTGIVSYILKPVKPNDLKNLWQFVDKTKKGKSVAIEETRTNIAHDSSSRRPDNINLGRFDDPIIPFGGEVGGPRFGGSVLRNNNLGGNKRTREDGDDGDMGRTSPKKPCNRKYPNTNTNNNNNKSPSNNKNTNYKKPMIKRRRRPNKAKIIWTNSLHNRFLLAVRHLGYNTVPKKILEFMNVPGLTRENVASHLQKYRLFLKRVAENGILGVTKLLTDKFMRSSFANGYPVELILQHAREMYPQLYRKAVERQLQDQQIRQQLLGQQSTSSVPQPRGPTTTSFHGASSSRGPAPVGLSTLLMDNRPPTPSNVVRQPFLHSTSYNNANNAPVGIATVLQNSGTDNQGPSSGFLSRNHSINDNNNAGSSTSAGGSNIGPRVLTRFGQQAGTNIAYGPFGITLVDSDFGHDNNSIVGNPTPAPFHGGWPSQGAGGNNETVEIDDNIFGNNAIDMDMNINDLLGDDNSDVGGQFGSNNQLGFEDYDNTFGLDTDLFSPGLLNDIVQQPIGQVQGNDQVVLNKNDGVLPFDFIPFQNEGHEQMFPSSNTGYAIPSDNYYSGINQIPLQAPQVIVQVMQNPGGNNIESLGGIEQILQNPTNNNVHPLANDQIVQNPENFNNSLPSLNTYFPDPLDQITPLPNVPSTANNVPPFDAYVPSFDNILPQQSVNEEFGDPFQQINLENMHSEMDWDEFIGCMLNDDVPDLRE